MTSDGCNIDMASPPHDARAVANFLLDAADTHNITLSITSLLKIIYFAQGWHLAKYNRPLIGQSFEAWEFGPVIRVVYDSLIACPTVPGRWLVSREGSERKDREACSAAEH